MKTGMGSQHGLGALGSSALVIGYSCALRRTISYIYALASTTLDNLLREVPRREELISEYQQICLDLQAEVVALLALLDDQQPQ